MFINRYVSALWGHWLALVGGSVALLISAAQYGFQLTGSHRLDSLPLPVLLVLGFVCLITAGYRAWKDEHLVRIDAEKRIYDGRPLFVLNVIRQPSWASGKPMHEQIFELTNCGGRPARFIRVEEQKSKLDYSTMRFSQILSLSAGETKPLGYAIDQHGDHQGMLFEFLSDNSSDSALVWWDIGIVFRDTDESEQREVVRLCFEVKSKYLYSREVPYTRRDFKQQTLVP